MLGTWRWNLWFGVFGLLLIFLISLSSNPLITSLFRGTYAFISFFLIAYPVRFAFGIMDNSRSTDQQEIVDELDQPIAGSTVNYVTPDEHEDLNDVLKAQISKTPVPSSEQTAVNSTQSQFQPLNPTKLVSTDKMEPEELTKVIRHLTGE